MKNYKPNVETRGSIITKWTYFYFQWNCKSFLFTHYCSNVGVCDVNNFCESRSLARLILVFETKTRIV